MIDHMTNFGLFMLTFGGALWIQNSENRRLLAAAALFQIGLAIVMSSAVLAGAAAGCAARGLFLVYGTRAIRCIEAGTEPVDMPTKLFYRLLMYLDASERG